MAMLPFGSKIIGIVVEIADRCGFYLDKNLISYVELMTNDEKGFDWKHAVAIVLQEVYKGDFSLANYCALGLRASGRPGICRRLFIGLYKWICKLAGQGVVISREMYVKHINKLASNKR